MPLPSSPVVATMRLLLKKKKLGYRTLGNAIGMSESGIKKLFSGKDISLSRIQQIAAFLEISLTDLFYLAQNQEILEHGFTPLQEKAFLENPQLFEVLWQLSIEGKTAQEILGKKKYQTSHWQKILHRLQSLDLIKLSPSGTISFSHYGLFRWSMESAFVKKISEEWSHLTAKRALRNWNKIDYLHRLGYLKLHPQTQELYRRRISEILDEAARTSAREKQEYPASQLKSLTYLVAMAPEGFLDVI